MNPTLPDPALTPHICCHSPRDLAAPVPPVLHGLRVCSYYKHNPLDIHAGKRR
jgi:hypothetical protein